MYLFQQQSETHSREVHKYWCTLACLKGALLSDHTVLKHHTVLRYLPQVVFCVRTKLQVVIPVEGAEEGLQLRAPGSERYYTTVRHYTGVRY